MKRSQRSTTEAGYVRSHGIAQLFFWSAFYYLLPALSAQIASETGWPVLHISTTYTLAFLLWALCAPLVGLLIDAGHGSHVMRIGALVGIALLVGLSQTTDKTVFSLVVILLGACMAATLYDPCFAVMMRRLTHAGPDAVASVTLIAGFATLVTFPLVIGLSGVMAWHTTVLLFATLAAIGILILPAEPKPTAQTRPHLTKMPFDKGPILIALSFGLVMMSHAILLFLLPIALVPADGGVNVALFALAILGPSQIAGRIIWRTYGRAFSAQNCAIVIFACLCLPATLFLAFGTGPWVLGGALVLQGACYGVHTILRPGLAQHYLHPAYLGRGLGGIAMVGLCMMAVAPVIGGAIWTALGITGLMGAILGLNGVAFLLGLVLRATPGMGEPV